MADEAALDPVPSEETADGANQTDQIQEVPQDSAGQDGQGNADEGKDAENQGGEEAETTVADGEGQKEGEDGAEGADGKENQEEPPPGEESADAPKVEASADAETNGKGEGADAPTEEAGADADPLKEGENVDAPKEEQTDAPGDGENADAPKEGEDADAEEAEVTTTDVSKEENVAASENPQEEGEVEEPEADTGGDDEGEDGVEESAAVEENAGDENEPQDENTKEEDENEEPQTAEPEATEDDAPKIEDQAQTPEPPTEHMATSTEPTQPANTEDTTEAAAAAAAAPAYDENAQATVKFMLMPSQQVATMRCHLHQTLKELKQHFATELKIPVTVIMLTFNGGAIDDTMKLGDLGVGPNGTIQLEMQSVDPVNTPIKRFKPRQEYHMPDVITVRVPAEDGGFNDVVVEIERSMHKKPFLGGYRHKKTNIEFHHAACQTVQKPRPPANVERFCRDTQTSQQRNMVQQTTNNTSTQMTKIGVYVSNMTDKLIVPGKYTTADDYKSNILKQVVLIQKYYRRWLAKRYVDKVRLDKQKRLEWEREEEVKKKKEKEARIQREFERRMNPKTKEDFDLLYHALEKWRQEELVRINETLSGAERKAALYLLLEQETQLIASIGRHKQEADTENKDKSVEHFLEKAAAPKKWKGPDGKYTEMDTPYTIRAQELKDIYNSINMKYLTQDERLDVLLTLKHTVKEHDCKLTQEIIELIDREADLLMRGVRETNLDGLRKRISTLFLQYIKTPTFNPEAARLLKVPQDPSTLRKNIYFCPSCNQYLPSTEFQLSSNSRAVGRCRRCTKADNDGRIRQDYSHFRFMLQSLREKEEEYEDGSKIAFLLQESDLRYLVENVWNSQSIVSAWEDLYDLVLVRWNRHMEWSPWNCILLTKEEATAHEKLEDMDEAYGEVFIHKVNHKHTLARNYFSRLLGMAEKMNEASQLDAASNDPVVSGKRLTAVSMQA